jgi:hypothetical protein
MLVVLVDVLEEKAARMKASGTRSYGEQNDAA